MTTFIKVSDLLNMRSNKDKMPKTISLLFNRDRIKTSKVGRYFKPIRIVYVYDNNNKEYIDNHDCFFNIPASLDDAIHFQDVKYLAMFIYIDKAKEFIQDDGTVLTGYEKGLGIIRNPLQINILEDLEKEAYVVEVYVF